MAESYIGMEKEEHEYSSTRRGVWIASNGEVVGGQRYEYRSLISDMLRHFARHQPPSENGLGDLLDRCSSTRQTCSSVILAQTTPRVEALCLLTKVANSLSTACQMCISATIREVVPIKDL